jgi:ferredoxin
VKFKINLRTRDGALIVFDADTSETLLDAAVRSQILLPSGCREGACGTCRVTCNEGEVALDLPKDSALSLSPSVKDDGPGMGAEVVVAQALSLGMGIMESCGRPPIDQR